MTKLNIREIQRVVAERAGITVEELISADRTKRVVDYRMIAMYLARRLTGKSSSDIGRHFGDRDHSTVIHARQAVPNRKDLLRAAQALEREILEPTEFPGVFPWRIQTKRKPLHG
jgi:chromosomal replication initiation ATPase DnaA